MFSKPPRHYSPLFRDFRAIEPRDYQRMIREYEEKEQQIGRLDPEEHFELTVLYVDALFATGAHRRHMLMVDLVIYASIDRNIQFLNGEDVYERMLFRKAASAYRIQQYQQAEHISRELMRMRPANPIYRRLLTTSLFRQQKPMLQLGRAAAIFCFLLTALVIVLDLLVIKNFFPAEHRAVIWLRNDVFLIGILIFLGTFGFAYYRSWKRAADFASIVKKQKSTKK